MGVKLVIVMRNDLDSMNPGKLAAQAAHAGSQVFSNNLVGNGVERTFPCREFNDWLFDSEVIDDPEEDYLGFGVTIVKEAKAWQLNKIVDLAESDPYFIPQRFGQIFDPTYPVKDGEVTHLVAIKTGLWLLYDDTGKYSPTISFVNRLELHK